MLFSLSLASKLGKRGLLSYSLHPGVIGTNLGSHVEDWESLSRNTLGTLLYTCESANQKRKEEFKLPLPERADDIFQETPTDNWATRRAGLTSSGRRMIRAPQLISTPPLRRL